MNVSGHGIGTAEVEGAIGKADSVAEAAVYYPHDIKGQGIYAFAFDDWCRASDEIFDNI